MESFESQVQKQSEFLKNLDSLCRLIEERVAIEDQHIKNVEKITCKLEQLKFEGDISDLVKEICLGQREQLNGAKNHVSLVKGETLELLKKSVKGQTAQNKSFKSNQKTLNDEYIQILDKFNKSKEEYIAHTKDFDLVALETEISALNQKVDYEKKIEAREKCIKLQKASETKKEVFFLHSFQYNDFLDHLEKESEILNKNLSEHKQESVCVLKKALTVFLDFEKVVISEFTQKIEPFYSQINNLNLTHSEENLRIITSISANSQAQQQPIERSSFLKEGLKEIQDLNCSNEKEEEPISAFRQYFQNVIKSNPLNSDELSHLSIKENLAFVANTIHKAWQGESLDQKDTEKMKDLMNEKLFRNIFVVCLQQYRLAGQFTLNFAGFENIKDLLCNFVEKCFTEKDTLNAYKIIILSQTFWRNLVFSTGKEAEKVYLQSTIKTMEIWKDLEFWQAAIFTSLYKELLFKNSARNQADEHKNDSAENQNLIVTGLLMSFIHVMSDFGVERKSILILIKQFNQYYNLGETTIKELENIVDRLSFNGKDTSKCLLIKPKTNNNNFNSFKKGKLESIKNLFNKKNSSNGPRTIIETQTQLIEGKTK